MTRKRIFSVVLIAALVIVVGILMFLNHQTFCGGFSGRTITTKAVSWTPGKHVLEVSAGKFCAFSVYIPSPKTPIIIPDQDAKGKPMERMLITDAGQWYLTAFCPGDTVELTRENGIWNDVARGAKIEVNEVRNKGERKCGL
jgi:hypothetical protein